MSSFGQYILEIQQKPAHISDNYNAFQLCKFFKTENFLNDFLDGKFYMSSVGLMDKYINLNLSDGQADELEGTEEYLQTVENMYHALEIIDGSAYIASYYGDHNIQKNKNIIYEAKVGRHKYINCNLYCFYTLWFDTDNNEIAYRDTKMKTEFGDYGIIVRNPIELMNRIYTGILTFSQEDKLNSKPIIGFVEYLELMNKGMESIGPFRKDNSYSYQNEFRFLIDIKNQKGDLKYFEVGDLRDIVSVISSDDLINNTYIDNNILKIGNKQIDYNLNNI